MRQVGLGGEQDCQQSCNLGLPNGKLAVEQVGLLGQVGQDDQDIPRLPRLPKMLEITRLTKIAKITKMVPSKNCSKFPAKSNCAKN